VPGAVAFEAELGVAVGAGDELLGFSVLGGVAVFGGEVEAAFRGEAGDEVGAGGEVGLRKSGIVANVISDEAYS
jgi:hypothetical protein